MCVAVLCAVQIHVEAGASPARVVVVDWQRALTDAWSCVCAVAVVAACRTRAAVPQPSRMDFVINPGSRVDPLDGPKGGLQPGAKPGGKPKVSEAAAKLKPERNPLHGTVRRPGLNRL